MTFLLGTFGVLGQTPEVMRPVTNSDFQNCKDVENDALKFAEDVPDRTYFLVLYPGDEQPYSYFHPPAFVSEQPFTPKAFAWIGGVAPEALPDAIFYSVEGAIYIPVS